MFHENELYHFLNDEYNLEGQIILGIYKNIKKLDSARLKDLLILNELRKDRKTFK